MAAFFAYNKSNKLEMGETMETAEITSWLVKILFLLNFLFAIVVVFLERRTPVSTWAWLMILWFIPVLGFVLYLMLGQNLSRKKIFKWDKHVYAYIKREVVKQMEQLKAKKLHFHDPVGKEYQDLVYLHLNNDEALLTQDNQVEIITDGLYKFERLFEDIRRASKHVHLLYYIIKSDELGNRLADLLCEKSREGIEVRVLFDESGSRWLSKGFVRRIRQAGGQIEPFFPAKIPLLNLRANNRNHRKIVVIDGEIGYIGGFNIGDEYLGKNPAFGYWRDTHLRIEGSAVDDLQSRFMLDWKQASGRDMAFRNYYQIPSDPRGDIPLQIVSSGPDSRWEQIKNGYMKLILTAKEYVYIQTPYLIPDDSILDALRIAALSGVDVKIMIPNKPDHPFVYWATYSNAGELLRAGAKVYTYENGFMHAKTIVVDDKLSTVGTANIDVRSFRLNFEVNAFVYHSHTAKQLANHFLADVELSSELTLEKYRQRPLSIRLKESVSRLLSAIL
ncbi:Major cardiolipin synthase ClsA [Brevibacillus laterosporus]|nr:Major cardiolipin synthase ClsA [Brevibacillus laterosporus]